jgi:hypothetical protein
LIKLTDAHRTQCESFGKLSDAHCTQCESFGRAFLKARAGGGREALLALRRARNPPNGAFLFVSFFFCAYMVKRKSG